MNNSPNAIEQLIFLFAKLPGLGRRSARRIVLYLMQDEVRIKGLSTQLMSVVNEIKECEYCGNLDQGSVCTICQHSERDSSIIAVVESVADLWALERSKIFKGHYHVLGGTLSAAGNNTPETLKLPKLLYRIQKNKVKEIILATNSTLDGQMTSFFIMDYLKSQCLKISKLASGIPLGGELDYLDEGTLSTALKFRQVCD